MKFSYLSLILLLVLSQSATEAMRGSGFKVGLMGANLAKIRAAMEEVSTVWS